MALMRTALAVLLLLIAIPIANLIASASPRELAAALLAPGTLDAARTSVLASLGATALASLLGIPAGYVLARSRGPAGAAATALLAVPLALPPVASGIVLLGLVGRREPLGALLAAHGAGLVDTLGGVALCDFFVAGSIVAIASAAAFSGVEVRLEEAARTLGASPLRVLRTIALPLAAPGIAAGVLVAWLRAIGEYGATSLVAYHPTSLPIALVTSLSADGVPRALALSEAVVAVAAVAALAVALGQRRLT